LKHFEIDFDAHSISDPQRIHVDIVNFIFIPKTPSDECLHRSLKGAAEKMARLMLKIRKRVDD